MVFFPTLFECAETEKDVIQRCHLSWFMQQDKAILSKLFRENSITVEKLVVLVAKEIKKYFLEALLIISGAKQLGRRDLECDWLQTRPAHDSLSHYDLIIRKILFFYVG